MKNQFLTDIVEYKKRLLKEKNAFFSSLEECLDEAPIREKGLFKRNISQAGQINLIAEIKKASPSKGIIREDFDPLTIADIYVEHNAAAISVLTEDKYFLGKPEFVKQVSSRVNIPVLTKDFIIDKRQIFEAKLNGASAVLLIVAILDDVQLKSLIKVASSSDLDCLVEVHNKDELKRAIDAGAEIVGINNRDLHTFMVDLDICKTLIPKISKDKVVVAESGLKTHEEIKELYELGAHAVLIGETFMRVEDIGSKIKELMKSKKEEEKNRREK